MRRVVIAGAGVLGAAIGWRLASAGHGVTLVDPTPGGVASPGSFAWLNASFAEDPVYNRLRHDSLELWKQMKAEDPTVPVTFPGSILWEQEHFDLDAITESQVELGRPAAILDRSGVREREPAVAEPPDKALLLAGDGYGDPVAITSWFLDQAKDAGATLLAGERITDIQSADGAVAGVVTTNGPIPADYVILAAGIELRALLRPIGLDVAMHNEPGLLARTSAAAPQIRAMLATPEVHIWQHEDGRFLIGADFGGGGPVDDAEADARRVLGNLKAVLPGAVDCSVETITVRERPKPLDGRPAIGPLGPKGLYIVSTHSGMTLAPVIGECVCREIGEGIEDPRLAPYRPDRAALQAETA